MRQSRQASVVVVAVFAVLTGIGGFARTIDLVIAARGGKPVIWSDPSHQDLIEDGSGVAIAVFGFTVVVATLFLASGVGLLRGRNWARLVLRGVALVTLALSVGVMFLQAYWRWWIAAESPPEVDVVTPAFWLLVVAVLEPGRLLARPAVEAPPPAAGVSAA